MTLTACKKWTIIVIFAITKLKQAQSQFPFPAPMSGPMPMMPGPMPMMPAPMPMMPAPMPMIPAPMPMVPGPMPVPMMPIRMKPINLRDLDIFKDLTSTTAKTTTTDPYDPNNIDTIPFPMPFQVQLPPQPSSCIYVSGVCQTCPPCSSTSCDPCVPNQFAGCSQCHSQCQCKSKDRKKESCSHGSDEDRSCTKCRRSGFRSHRRSHRRRIFRSADDYHSHYDADRLVQPVLTYLNKHGEIKITKNLNTDEAEALLHDSKEFQEVKSMKLSKPRKISKSDKKKLLRNKIKNYSNDDEAETNVLESNEVVDVPSKTLAEKRKISLSRFDGKKLFSRGKKQVVVIPPSNKKIKNLTLTFHLDNK